MAKPFKFRYVNEIVGTFVLAIVALLVIGILLAGRAQEWFVPVRELHLDFPEEGSLGLQKGAAVEVLGTGVGRVERIFVQDDGRMAGLLSIKDEFSRFIRTDSRAIVKKRFGVAGEAFLEITEGRGEWLGAEDRLAVEKDTELTELLANLVTQIQEATVPAIAETERTVVAFGKLAEDLRDPEGPLFQLLANLEAISGGLERGEGPAGMVLRDPQMAETLQSILDRIQAALEDLQRTTAQLPAMASTVAGEVADMPGLVLQTQETIRESERLIEGIQRHWLLRKHVPQPTASVLIPAGEVRAP